MSEEGWCVDKHIERTITYLLRCPRSSVMEAMRVCRFSAKESSNAGKQMAVRRAHEKAASGKRKALPPILINLPTVGLAVSPMTTEVTGSTLTTSPPSTPTTPGSTRPTQSTSRDKPKMKLIRRISQAMQKVRLNMLAILDHSKRALKRAMRWYTREKNYRWIVVVPD
jgi:hypothetical protein